MLSHVRVLLASTPEGATTYIDADLRATGTILEQAAAILDFGQPVAVMLLGIPGPDEPGAIIARLMNAVTHGSWDKTKPFKSKPSPRYGTGVIRGMREPPVGQS